MHLHPSVGFLLSLKSLAKLTENLCASDSSSVSSFSKAKVHGVVNPAKHHLSQMGVFMNPHLWIQEGNAFLKEGF